MAQLQASSSDHIFARGLDMRFGLFGGQWRKIQGTGNRAMTLRARPEWRGPLKGRQRALWDVNGVCPRSMDR